ncbi:hypothetical protein OPQ81_002131 [Rhizoctonia solani]|nr:hypothetical protein OPQ81_002131 [Rhizoctonia solani]
MECVIAIDEIASRDMSLGPSPNRAGINANGLQLTQLFRGNKGCWRLEQIGDTAGEGKDVEKTPLSQQPKDAKSEVVEDKSKLNVVEEQLTARVAELEQVQSELKKKTAEADQAIKDLSVVMEEMSEKSAIISEKDRVISERDEIILMKDTGLAEKSRVIAAFEQNFRNQKEEIGRDSEEETSPPVAPFPQRTDTITANVLPSINPMGQQPGSAPETIWQTVLSQLNSPPSALDEALSKLGWDFD